MAYQARGLKKQFGRTPVVNGKKECNRCHQVKCVDAFYKATSGNPSNPCKQCAITVHGPARKKYAEAHRQEGIERGRSYRHKLRLEVFERYGKVCYCCGENRWQFLALDHIEGGGNKHRLAISGDRNFSGYKFHLWLKRNNWPNGLRVACHSCNMATGFYGECPHQTELKSLNIQSVVGGC
jgi:hypothetical protein